MTNAEIKDKIADLEKRVKNPSLPASAVAALNKKIAELKSEIKQEAKAEPEEKAEPKKKAEPKVKAERKPKAKKEDKSEPKDKPTSKMTDEEYSAYCAELMAKAKERKAKAKAAAAKRADEPKKTPATKNKEAVRGAAERVEKNVEKRVEKGEVSVSEIEKLIKEYEEAITKLKALLKKAKTTTKFKLGGSVNSKELSAILKDAHSVKDSHCKCNDKMAKGGLLKDKANYIPNRMISTLEVERNGKTIDIDPADILDGVYVKKGVKYGEGGGLYSENAEMVLNNNVQIMHHTEELRDAVKKSKDIPAWVVAKVYDATETLSDVTHYLDGENKMAKGGLLKDKATYIPNRMISTLEVERNGKITDIDPAEILDGIYVKKRVKYADGGGVEEKLYYVVGKKNGQLVTISELPMSKNDAQRFIDEQRIEMHYQNVDIIPYRGKKQRYYYATGGGVLTRYKIVFKNDKGEKEFTTTEAYNKAEALKVGKFLENQKDNQFYRGKFKAVEVIEIDKMADGGSVTDGDFGAEKAGERKSRKYSTVEIKSGGEYTRRNANQYGRAKGGRNYTENRPDRSDKKRWI
jgi:hypothetical protein